MRLAAYYDTHKGPLSRGEPIPAGSRHLVRWAESQPDGTERERARRFRLKRDAVEHVNKINTELTSGRTAPSLDGKSLISEVAPKWLASKLKVKDASHEKFEGNLRRRILPRFGDSTVGSVSRLEVEQWIQALLAGTAPAVYNERETRQVGPLAPSTVRGLLRTLQGVFEYARLHQWMSAANPAAKHELPDPEETPRMYLDFVELEALSTLVGSRVSRRPIRRDQRADLAETAVLFMGYTGLRIGETLALRGADVMTRDGKRRVRVARTWTTTKEGRPLIGTTTKAGGTRYVGLPDFLWERVDWWAARAEGDALFPAPRGGFESPTNWRNRIWTPGVAGSEFEAMDLTPHDLRHAAASIAIASGADVKVVQDMLGHKSAAMTLDIYAALFPDRQDEVTDRVSARRAAALARRAASQAA